MENSTDTYYREHNIKSFRDLLICSDGECKHTTPPPPPPKISASDQSADSDKVSELFDNLHASQDERAKLLIKCLTAGLKWAGSSFTEFLSKGTAGLLLFLSEKNPSTGDTPASVSHDIDLYRPNDSTQKLGKRFIGNEWISSGPVKARAVDKWNLTLVSDHHIQLQIDQVNLHKSNMNPSTDLWPNICASYTEGRFCVEQLWETRGPPLVNTLHNALRLQEGSPVPCYVLRRPAMPTYDEHGKFQENNLYCDGRFRKKLHIRSKEKRLVDLVPSWKPGPHILPLEYFERLAGNAVSDDGTSEDGEDDVDFGSIPCNEADTIPLAEAQTTMAIRNWQPSLEAGAQQISDAALAKQLARQMELNPHGDSMRNRPAVNREQRHNQRPARTKRFAGSYLE